MSEPMNLRGWLRAHNERPEEFADRVGVHRATVYRILKGEDYTPSLPTALAIQKATGGVVRVESLIGNAA